MADGMRSPTGDEVKRAVELTAAYKDLADAVGDWRRAIADADDLSMRIGVKDAEVKETLRRFIGRYGLADDEDERVQPRDVGAVLSDLSGLYYRYQDAQDEHRGAMAAIDACHDRVKALRDDPALGDG